MGRRGNGRKPRFEFKSDLGRIVKENWVDGLMDGWQREREEEEIWFQHSNNNVKAGISNASWWWLNNNKLNFLAIYYLILPNQTTLKSGTLWLCTSCCIHYTPRMRWEWEGRPGKTEDGVVFGFAWTALQNVHLVRSLHLPNQPRTWEKNFSFPLKQCNLCNPVSLSSRRISSHFVMRISLQLS